VTVRQLTLTLAATLLGFPFDLPTVLRAVDVGGAVEAGMHVVAFDLVLPLAQLVPTAGRLERNVERPPPLRLGGDAAAGLDRLSILTLLLAFATTIRLGSFSLALSGESGGSLRVPSGSGVGG
jgi:hypothetical protein